MKARKNICPVEWIVRDGKWDRQECPSAVNGEKWVFRELGYDRWAQQMKGTIECRFLIAMRCTIELTITPFLFDADDLLNTIFGASGEYADSEYDGVSPFVRRYKILCGQPEVLAYNSVSFVVYEGIEDYDNIQVEVHITDWEPIN